MQRRTLLKRAALLGALAPASGAGPLFDQQELPPPPSTGDRLDQGPFDVDQDQGWLTVLFTTPSETPQRNPGLGLVGYTWEEGGPSLAARAGRETLERHVENISALPFVDVLYIRCDWRGVQFKPCYRTRHPIWELTLGAAQGHGLRVALPVPLCN